MKDRFQKNAPRYTSYPPASYWSKIFSQDFVEALQKRDPNEPLSLYIHIPFCPSLCLYCGCSTILTKSQETIIQYLDTLIQELLLLRKTLSYSPLIHHIHFGGGSPTILSLSQMEKLFQALSQNTTLSNTSEISIEVDPRNISLDYWQGLFRLGFTRISLGVQDTNHKVQEAIKRRQSKEVTYQAFLDARCAGFSHFNVDLIYGLPLQTKKTVEETAQDIITLRPDRIALFSYAHVPLLKPHQNALRDLPNPEEKLEMFQTMKSCFIEAGYISIGMDHFALSEDSLSKALKMKTLRRNFQGYTTHFSDLYGVGLTSISTLSDGFFQNTKEIALYQNALETEIFPTAYGKRLSQDDNIRGWVIEKLLCYFEVDKDQFQATWGTSFDEYFHIDLSPFIEEGLLHETPSFIHVEEEGKYYIRNIAQAFDSYFSEETIASRAL